MLGRKLKKYMPDRHKITKQKTLKLFGNLLHNPNLWHLNRYSVATAMSIGLFCAWIPVPFQMVIAAAGAILFHANLALSVGLVWLTNPMTMPALYYFAYKLGANLLGIPTKGFKFNLSWDWLCGMLQNSWQPFLLGCFILGTFSAIAGNLIIRMVWRYFTVKLWNTRKKLRAARKRIPAQKK